MGDIELDVQIGDRSRRTWNRDGVRWYSANGQFSDLQDYTAQIARDAGLTLSPAKAFQWLGTGGFTNDVLGPTGTGGFDFAAMKQIAQLFTGGKLNWEINKYNKFKLHLHGAREDFLPVFRDGRIIRQRCYRRQRRVLPGLRHRPDPSAAARLFPRS